MGQHSDGAEKVVAAIRQMGFPVELHVSEALTKRNYYVANNLYYVDQDEDKGREIDARALKNFAFAFGNHTIWVRHCLLIECKRATKGRPWVVFTSPTNAYDRAFDELDHTGLKELRPLVKELRPILKHIHPFEVTSRRGRAFGELFREGDEARSTDPVFKALITAVKATRATRDGDFGNGPLNVFFFYPIVVFDGPLWESRLEEGEITAAQVDTLVASVSYESPKYPAETHSVCIVTLKAFDALLGNLDTILETTGAYLERNSHLVITK
jgi:hypothetical protein